MGGEYVVSFGGWVFSNEYRSLYRTLGAGDVEAFSKLCKVRQSLRKFVLT